uniref:Uncharacterized protein n=1 Tax=Ditylenchus dipsaci TaxID=166011 RepID=A0A915DSE4_9BILA
MYFLLCVVINSFVYVQCAKKKKKTKVKPTATQDYLPPTSFGTDEVRFTTSEESVNQPKRAVPNKKEEMIKKGMLIRQKNEYPTMDDVASDWEDSAESKLNPTKGTGSSLMVKKGDKKATASKKKKKALS